jgi:preprotein translocase subunit YajC
MNLPFFSDALAATPNVAASTQQAQAGGLNIILISVLFVAVFYFLMIRPQAKRNKTHQQLMNNLQKGDEVATIGGMLGRVIKIEENIVTLELAENTQIKIQKNSVASLLPKGTLKN